MPFTCTPLDGLPDLIRVQPRRFADERGWFEETWAASLPDIGPFVQDNRSYSRHAGTLRGLHLQRAPHAQGKLIECVAGRIWDVGVDIRPESPTFGQWAGIDLAPGDGWLWLPPGFAHGFVTLEPETIVQYKVTSAYAPDAEGAIRWDDGQLGIDWPRAVEHVSAKDAAAGSWDDLVEDA